MKRILLGMMMVLLANAAWAQSATKVIKGVVTDAASGEALIGAIVRVKNQTKQATTLSNRRAAANNTSGLMPARFVPFPSEAT